MRIDVYRKPGCQLCDAALELLDDQRAQFDFVLETHNILEDTVWFEKYRYLVPVVVIDGIQRLSLRFDSQELEAALRASQATP
jgi:glutaredoxin